MAAPRLKYEMHIDLTDAAQSRLRSILELGGFVRISVYRKGCAGIVYRIEQVDQISDNDDQVEINGVTLLFDRPSIMFIIGTHIDFKDDVTGRGFVFNNEAFQPCGCGMSFRG